MRSRLIPPQCVCTVAGMVLAALLAHLAAGAEAPVPLGSAATYAVLAGATVTSTGATAVDGDLGLSPGTAVTGFPPGVLTNGLFHVADAAAAQAQADLTLAYNDAAGRTSNVTVQLSGELGGLVLPPGVYKAPAGSFAITTTDLTLDAEGDVHAVWIFQMPASTLTVGSARQVILAGGASAARVFWQVGSSATLGTGSAVKGTLLANQSITLQTGATLEGRALARLAAITLDGNVVGLPDTNAPPLLFVDIYRAGGGIEGTVLVLTNTPDLEVTVQRSRALTNWTTLSTTTPTATPYVTTDTTTSVSITTRMYRAFYP